jgi:hypothetical protein
LFACGGGYIDSSASAAAPTTLSSTVYKHAFLDKATVQSALLVSQDAVLKVYERAVRLHSAVGCAGPVEAPHIKAVFAHDQPMRTAIDAALTAFATAAPKPSGKKKNT